MKKRPLTDEERTLLVDYRIQRAKETLSEADNLIEAGFFNAAVNRLLLRQRNDSCLASAGRRIYIRY